MPIAYIHIIAIISCVVYVCIIFNNWIIPLIYKTILYPALAKNYKYEIEEYLKTIPWVSEFEIQLKSYEEPFISSLNNQKQYLYQGKELENCDLLNTFIFENDIKTKDISEFFRFFNELQKKTKTKYNFIKISSSNKKITMRITGYNFQSTRKY